MTKDEYTASKTGATSLSAQPVASTAAKQPLWKSFEQFNAGNPEALKKGYYGGAAGIPLPQYSKDYDAYRNTLPDAYRVLSMAGINPADVESGKVKKVWDRSTGKMLDIPLPGGGFAGQGSGSSHALSSDVLNKMWR